MQDYKYIKIEKKGKICVITLNNPNKKNALSDALRSEIIDALDILQNDNHIKSIIFYGGEEYFSTGFDKDEVQASIGDSEKMKHLRDATILFQKKIWKFPKLIIAAINGYALGGGFDLAVISHLRIAANNAIFGHPEIRFGAPPLFFSYMTLVGRGKALELVLNTATKDTFITAEEAYRLNIVNKVVEPENVLKEAIKMAKQINKSPDLTVKMMIKVNNIFFDQAKAFETEIETIVDNIKMN